MTRTLAFTLGLLYLATAGTALGCVTSRRSRSAPPAATTTQNALLLNYENARLALIDGSPRDVQIAAKGITNAADRAGQRAIGNRSAKLEDAQDLAAARQAFAVLSDEIIEYHRAHPTGELAVASCSMEKKSWLQPKGRISNPYVDDDMRRCGEFVDSATTPSTGGSATHQH